MDFFLKANGFLPKVSWSCTRFFASEMPREKLRCRLPGFFEVYEIFGCFLISMKPIFGNQYGVNSYNKKFYGNL